MYGIAALIVMTAVVSLQAVNISIETDLQQLFAGSAITRQTSSQLEGLQETFTATLAKSKKEIVATLSPSLGYWVKYRTKCWQRNDAQECFKFLQAEYQKKVRLQTEA